MIPKWLKQEEVQVGLLGIGGIGLLFFILALPRDPLGGVRVIPVTTTEGIMVYVSYLPSHFGDKIRVEGHELVIGEKRYVVAEEGSTLAIASTDVMPPMWIFYLIDISY